MLGKLIKHEFRATARIMLPVIGVMALLILLAATAVTFGDALVERFQLATLLVVLLTIVAFVAVIAAEIGAIVVMVLRFYRNLLGPEGYLMHTLPATAHELVWSKLIVSAVWILAVNLALILMLAVSGLIISRTSVGDIFAFLKELPPLSEILAEFGVTMGQFYGMLALFIVSILISVLASCLQFYAALSLGHMFSKDKILLSIVFYLGISFVLSLFANGILIGLGFVVDKPSQAAASFTVLIQTIQTMCWIGLGITLAECVLLYFTTVFGLKKGLNLA